MPWGYKLAIIYSLSKTYKLIFIKDITGLPIRPVRTSIKIYK